MVQDLLKKCTDSYYLKIVLNKEIECTNVFFVISINTAKQLHLFRN